MHGFNLSAWAVRHRALVLFTIIATALAGTFAYLQMGRAEDPRFTIKAMTVAAVWPGATAEEMQRLVADPLEAEVMETRLFDRVDTYTRPGFMAMAIQWDQSAPRKEAQELFYQTRKKLSDIRHTLPQGVQGPFFNDEYGDVYSKLYSLTGDGIGNAELVRQAEILRARFLRVPNVDKVDIVGEEPQRIFVEFSHAKLAALGISPQLLFDSLARQNAVVPSGIVETGLERVPLRVTGALDGVAAVEAVPVAANGRILRVGDIATVSRGYADPPGFQVRYKGKPAVVLAISMTEGANGLKLGEDLSAAEAEIRTDLPVGVELHRMSDQPTIIRNSVNEFLQKFVAALTIVLLVSFASLGMRTGVVVALSVPLTLAMTFVVMQAVGMEFDRITLGALILSLGLLVDDAIIAIEMMVVKLEEGWDRLKAASHAWTSTAMPMLTGTLITVAGFLPVGFARSAAGEYAGNIFWVLGIALIASWFVAVIFTPYLGFKLLPDPAARAKARGGHANHAAGLYDTAAYRALRRAVEACIRHRRKVVLATAALFLLAGYGMTHVSKQFFPTTARPELLIDLHLREGSSFAATSAAAAQAEAMLADDPDVLWHATYIGAGSPRFFLSLNPQLPNDSFAQIVATTVDTAARERVRARLQAAAADGAIPEARVRVRRLDFGPPVAYPVQFRVIGPDVQEARRIAERVRDIARANPHTYQTHIAWGEQVPRVRLEVDQDRARLLGVTPSDISQALRTLVDGAAITQMREGIELVEVVARAIPAERLELGTLPDLTIPTASGARVPLSQVARLSYESEPPILWRRNREPTVYINSDIVNGVQAPDVTAAIEPYLADIRAELPVGYRLETAGAIAESAKANTALFKVFPIMFLVMLLLLMVQLQDFSRMIMVFLTGPLGLIGAVAALLATGAAFGFVALLGLIALAGMIMRNTLILVDQIDVEVASGLSVKEAIVEATVRRARPVILTAMAAILAFVPLATSVFWAPMAVTLMGGLAVATVLTLVFLPALYALWFRVDRVRPAIAEAAVPAPQPAVPMAAE